MALLVEPERERGQRQRRFRNRVQARLGLEGRWAITALHTAISIITTVIMIARSLLWC